MKLPKIIPHPIKAKIKDAGIQVARVAVFLGISYNHCTQILSGVESPGQATREKLKILEDAIDNGTLELE